MTFRNDVMRAAHNVGFQATIASVKLGCRRFVNATQSLWTPGISLMSILISTVWELLE